MQADIPVSELPDRYGLVRSQIYLRLRALKERNPELTSYKSGGKAYVNAAVLECLDELNRLVTKENMKLDEAADIVTGSVSAQLSPGEQTDRPKVSGATAPAILGQPSDKISVATIRKALQEEPLARYKMLDEVAQNGWQLPTSELAAILELSTLDDAEFEGYGYRFTQAGQAGEETAWKVEKL